jgi:serine protease Do
MRRLWILGLAATVATLPLLATPVAAGEKDAKDQASEKKEEKVVRSFRFFGSGGGQLGVLLREVDQKAVERLKLPEERGALVQEVVADSPAEKAGLMVDDVIVRFKGDPVEGVQELVRRVRETPPGRTVSLEVLRKGSPLKLSAVLGQSRDLESGSFEMPELNFEVPNVEIPKFEIPHVEIPDLPQLSGHPGCLRFHSRLDAHAPRRLGIEYQELHGQLAQYFKVADERGVLVTAVEPEGPAAKAGVKVGDVLLEVAGEKIESGSDLRQALEDVKAGEEVALTVQRDGKPVELKLTAGGNPRKPKASTTKNL